VTRVLPQAEWSRVAHLDVSMWLPYVAPEDVRIVVLEDGDRIVGCWGAFRVVHLEGVWVDPAYRRQPHAVQALKDAAIEVASRWAPWAITGAATAAVRRLITRHLGGVPMPMESFAIPLTTKETVCQPQ
jgi:GNAT superfamily N-acetyltransferase